MLLLFFFPVTLALFSIISTVAGLTVLEPSSENPWYAGQKNSLRWTNATWDVTFSNYNLGLPWNATLFSNDPLHGGGAVTLQPFNGTDGEAVVDMSSWQEQGTQFILQFSYFAANRGTNLVFGSSENFTIAPSPSTVVKTSATGLLDSALSLSRTSSSALLGLAVAVVSAASVFL